ncbi:MULTISPECIES: RNA-binding S4 domain-containing protein [Marivita]|uniref:RNA-binding S4 domain-containing protein n=1 Tax=Marivita cryptomonadis TaxID=505252 RepID=A0A9Q2P4M6_9RHOB|nr:MULTISPECIES: RNA-binding S4 domain-containing protein [Marivita]MCR9167750.1 RNA-binding S4 domain-containing protein [Paracoccaceae bacterium]MBM2322155.1 RNA-binding S4 domain-containing protein [Marivita cryptomonadis]MBM2331736.1 RNA-binding S4 domain-containing protein [Marivita cryptomonadis]MBM2341321.1 RNA-binding S4 domain-containing protein [Marivita cryptomonadis]MBM2345984.1 RNA-binding S4 domain-containing protein [Marivita cryptomonadis]
MTEPVQKLRIDKWLWHARFFKTRSLAAKIVSGGKLRVNGQPISKPAYMVTALDVLTFPQANDVRVIKVLAMGERRGPAPEAQLLYDDLDPPKPREAIAEQVPRFEGKGRPTKKDRRALQQTRTDLLE